MKHDPNTRPAPRMQSVKIVGEPQRAHAVDLLSLAPLGSVMTLRTGGEARTDAQNRTLHMWYGEIAKHQDDLDATEVKGMCHRRWGLTIKMRDDKFAWVWQRSGAALEYEKQCKLLASGVLNVSSSMTTDELSEYMDAMSRHFRSEGIHLTDPEARKYEGAV